MAKHLFLTQNLNPYLQKGNSEDPSRVVNIASIDGIRLPLMETFSYTASKSAIIHLTRHLAKTLVKDNIIVNAIAPGPFDSHTFGKAVNLIIHLLQNLFQENELIPEDIAGLCLYLCSRAELIPLAKQIPYGGSKRYLKTI